MPLASLAVRCRSAVERNAYTREIENVAGSEAPARLMKVLAKLWAGMRVIGVPEADAWNALVKVALDSMPALRQQVLGVLEKAEQMETPEVVAAVGRPHSTTRRTLEDLMVHGVVTRQHRGARFVDVWMLSKKTRDWLERSGATFQSVPEMSEPLELTKKPSESQGDTPPFHSPSDISETDETQPEPAPDNSDDEDTIAF